MLTITVHKKGGKKKKLLKTIDYKLEAKIQKRIKVLGKNKQNNG